MNLGQGITMQKVVGETVKPQEFGVHQIRDISVGDFISVESRAGVDRWLLGNPAFLPPCGAAVRVPLTVDSPSATRADRGAV
jgi:hypothetical protein